MNKKIMIIGAGILQLPAIIKAKEIGLEVIAVDMDISAPGFKYADINLNISTIDIDGVANAAMELKPDGVMTLASDMPMRTVAAIGQQLGLLTIDEKTAINATNKAVMRRCLYENNVPIPKFYVVSSYLEYLSVLNNFGHKFIVKPADNSGSRGIFLVTKCDEIEKAYEYSKEFSRSGEILVEECMSGPEVSVETITVDGVTHMIAITDKLTTGAPNFVEMGHSQPTMLSTIIQEEIRKITFSTIKAIGIENGPSHTEIIITEEGPKIVEIGARLGGDNITTSLVPLSTGVDMVKECINISLGEKPDLELKFEKASAIRYFKSSKGILLDIEGIEKASLIDGVKEITFSKGIGDNINNINSSTERIGYVIAQGETPKKAIEICEKVLEVIKIKIGVYNENSDA